MHNARTHAHIISTITLLITASSSRANTPAQYIKQAAFCISSFTAVAATAKALYHHLQYKHHHALLQAVINAYNTRNSTNPTYLPSSNRPAYMPVPTLEQPYINLFNQHDYDAAKRYPEETPFYRWYVERNEECHEADSVGYGYLAALCAIVAYTTKTS